ncbi:hypothetical protein WAI453_005974 [Rhynchosporium graminicola]
MVFERTPFLLGCTGFAHAAMHGRSCCCSRTNTVTVPERPTACAGQKNWKTYESFKDCVKNFTCRESHCKLQTDIMASGETHCTHIILPDPQLFAALRPCTEMYKPGSQA